jgi:hypothetical protein
MVGLLILADEAACCTKRNVRFDTQTRLPKAKTPVKSANAPA